MGLDNHNHIAIIGRGVLIHSPAIAGREDHREGACVAIAGGGVAIIGGGVAGSPSQGATLKTSTNVPAGWISKHPRDGSREESFGKPRGVLASPGPGRPGARQPRARPGPAPECPGRFRGMDSNVPRLPRLPQTSNRDG